MKKILLIVPSNNGTIGLCSLNLYEALRTRPDVEVKCVLIHRYANGYPGFDDCEYCMNHTGSRLKSFFRRFFQIFWLRKIKNEFRPDMSVSTLFACSVTNVLTRGKEKKIGIFHSPHTQVRAKGIVAYRINLLYYKFVFPHLDKLFCVSREVKDSIITNFPEIDPNRVDIVYNVHNVDEIRRKAADPIDIPEEQNIFSHPTLLYCGRLDRNKAPERLLRAFIKSRLPKDVQLVYIGPDTDGLWTNMIQEAQAAGYANRVHYLGRKSNPYRYMVRATALVSCSYSEGLPGVLIESLILATPVLSTNSSKGIWEILSCPNRYDQDLKHVYRTHNGLISSNLAAADNAYYDLDIENLSRGLECVVEHVEEYHNDFEFIRHIAPANITDRFLAEIN